MPSHRTASNGVVLDFVLRSVSPHVPQNLSEDLMHRWVNQGGEARRRLRQALVMPPHLPLLNPTDVQEISVMTDHKEPLKKLLKRGEFETTHHADFSKLQKYLEEPYACAATSKIVVVHFGKLVHLDQVIAWGLANSYRPITVRECLNLAISWKKTIGDEEGIAITAAKPIKVGGTELLVWVGIGKERLHAFMMRRQNYPQPSWFGFVYEEPKLDLSGGPTGLPDEVCKD